VFCLQNPGLVLPVEGAPLVFSTDIAHDFVLNMQKQERHQCGIACEARRGTWRLRSGREQATSAEFDTQMVATLHGKWGFESFAGPSFHIRNTQQADWKVPEKDQGALIVGREDSLHLESICAICAEKISLKPADGKEIN